MKLGIEDLKKVEEMLNEAETIRPLVKQVILVLMSYSEELKMIPEAVSDWIVEKRIRAIKKYENAGFTRDDAILMTLDDIYATRKMGERMARNYNKEGK